MPVKKLSDPMLRLLSGGTKLAIYGSPNPGQKVTFEGTRQEIVEWLRDKGEELAEKAVRKEFEEVEITQLPERHTTKMVLRGLPQERLRDVFAEDLTERVGALVAEDANDIILREKKLTGGAVSTGVDRELTLISVHTEEPKIGKEVTVKYEPGTIGPIEMTIRKKSSMKYPK